MQPTPIRLFGATAPPLPRTLAGTREGKAAEKARAVECFRKLRRVNEEEGFGFMSFEQM